MIDLFNPDVTCTLRGVGRELNELQDWCKGLYSTFPCADLPYPASLDSDSIVTGLDMLDTWIRSKPGLKKVVRGQSQGAQVASAWMEKFRDDPTAPGGGELGFFLTGNPLRPRTGKLIGNYVVGGGKGVATPTDTKWLVLDVARKDDGWAIKRPWYDLWSAFITPFVHANYTKVDVTQPLSIQVLGNATLLVVP